MIEGRVTLRPVKKVKPGDRVYWLDGMPFKLEIVHSIQSSAPTAIKVEEK